MNDIHRERDLRRRGLAASVTYVDGRPDLVCLTVDAVELEQFLQAGYDHSECFPAELVESAELTGYRQGYDKALSDLKSLAKEQAS